MDRDLTNQAFCRRAGEGGASSTTGARAVPGSQRPQMSERTHYFMAGLRTRCEAGTARAPLRLRLSSVWWWKMHPGGPAAFPPQRT